MIVTRPKPLDEIMEMLRLFPERSICVVGCNICARKVETGGEPQVKAMAAYLKDNGRTVLDGIMLKHACVAESWEALVREFPSLSQADLLLVMSCGAGVSLLGRISGKPTLPALDTVSLGGARDSEIFEGLCTMCGQCDVGMFAGLCPKSSCPKSQINGPCGGSDGKNCEVGERECVWSRIFEILKSRDMLFILQEVRPPIKHDRRL